MPKRAPDPRYVHLTPVKRGDQIVVPARVGVGYIRERAPEHGLYMRLGMAATGVYVPARVLWEALDLIIDIEDRDERRGD